MKLRILSGAGLLAVATVISSSPAVAADPVDVTAQGYGKWGFDLSGRDTAVKPGDDFFGYANGAYLQKTAIPADRTWYGTINVLRDLSELRVHAMLDDAAAKAPVERFSLAYAQYYRNKWREDAERQNLVSDPHSPDKARVDVVLPNVDAWYKTWRIKPGDKLYLAPDQRVRVW